MLAIAFVIAQDGIYRVRKARRGDSVTGRRNVGMEVDGWSRVLLAVGVAVVGVVVNAEAPCGAGCGQGVCGPCTHDHWGGVVGYGVSVFILIFAGAVGAARFRSHDGSDRY
jgi:hypothetical protein